MCTNDTHSVLYLGCRRQGNAAEFSWVMKRIVLVSHAVLDWVGLHEFQSPDYSMEEGLVELRRINGFEVQDCNNVGYTQLNADNHFLNFACIKFRWMGVSNTSSSCDISKSLCIRDLLGYWLNPINSGVISLFPTAVFIFWLILARTKCKFDAYIYLYAWVFNNGQCMEQNLEIHTYSSAKSRVLGGLKGRHILCCSWCIFQNGWREIEEA